MNPEEYLETAKEQLITESKAFTGMPPLAKYTTNAAEWYHIPPIEAMVNINKWMPDATMLDIGCGYGTLSIVGAELGWRVHAVDYYFPSIPWRIRQKYDIDMQICNIETDTLPFRGQCIDIVVVIEVIEHLNGPVDYPLTEIRRVMNDGKYLLIGTPNADVWELEDPSETWEEYDNMTPTDPYHSRHFTEPELTEILERNGFMVINCSYHRDDKHMLILASKEKM